MRFRKLYSCHKPLHSFSVQVIESTFSVFSVQRSLWGHIVLAPVSSRIRRRWVASYFDGCDQCQRQSCVESANFPSDRSSCLKMHLQDFKNVK